MDSASEGEGLCMSYVGVGVWSVLLSYFCKSIAFWASPRLAHRSVGLVHFDWGRLDFGLQATSCGGGWVCSMSFSSSLDQQLSSLLFKCQMAGMQGSKWKQVTPQEFLTLNTLTLSLTPTIHLQVAGWSSAECSRTGILSCIAKAIDA